MSTVPATEHTTPRRRLPTRVARAAAALPVALAATAAVAMAPLPVAADTGSTGQELTGQTVEADPGEYPFAVALRRPWSTSPFCTGTLVDDDYVLTAAHCVDDGTLDFELVIGRADLLDETQGEVRNPSWVNVHPRWDRAALQFDVALVALDQPSTQQPVQLVSRFSASDARIWDAGDGATLVGYGATSQQGFTSLNLLEGPSVVMAEDAADDIGGYDGATMVGVDGQTNTCPGDSGGPALALHEDGSWRQFGVNSWSPGGGSGCGPDVFMRLAAPAISDWIAVEKLRPAGVCDGLDATHRGTDGPDVIYGTPGPDVIVTGSGDDVIHGYGGDDVICAGDGNDTVVASSGHDIVHAGAGHDEVRGGTGNDVLYGDTGADVLRGEGGDDTLSGYSGPDILDGSSGHDVLYGDGGADTIAAGTGNDHVEGGSGDDWAYGDGGDDTIVLGTGADTADGGSGHDTILGEGGDDLLVGGTGNDTLEGSSGHDTLRAGGGDDVVWAGTGDDRVDGSSGHDVLHGEGGNDEIIAGGGADVVYAGSGDDTIWNRDAAHDSYSDAIWGGTGHDSARVDWRDTCVECEAAPQGAPSF